MKRFLRITLATLAILAAAIPASANLHFKIVPVRWLNVNRWGCGTIGCLPADTTLVGLGSTKPDTTEYIGFTAAVPFPWARSAAVTDTLVRVGRFFLTADSLTTAGVGTTLDSLTFEVQGAAASQQQTNAATAATPNLTLLNQAPIGTSVQITRFITMAGGANSYAFDVWQRPGPVFSSPVSDGVIAYSGRNSGPLGWASIRFILRNVLPATALGQCRASFGYYVDD